VTAQAPLVVEDWTLTFTEMAADASSCAFEVRGSVTGPDGHGTSGQRFVSDSGRVCIEPDDWWLSQAFKLCKTHMQVGSTVAWRVRPMFVDQYRTPEVSDPTRQYATTLAQGMVNTRHVLDLKLEQGQAEAIAALRVYEPPLR
jgi:hypothetical protein